MKTTTRHNLARFLGLRLGTHLRKRNHRRATSWAIVTGFAIGSANHGAGWQAAVEMFNGFKKV